MLTPAMIIKALRSAGGPAHIDGSAYDLRIDGWFNMAKVAKALNDELSRLEQAAVARPAPVDVEGDTNIEARIAASVAARSNGS